MHRLFVSLAIGLVTLAVPIGEASADSPRAVGSAYESLQLAGACSPSEAGHGNINVTLHGFPLGKSSVTNVISSYQGTLHLTNSVVVSAANPSPTVVYSGFLPGDYQVQSSWTDAAGQSEGTGLNTGVIAPDCLANGDPAPISAPIVGIAATSGALGYWIVGNDGNVYAEGDADKSFAGVGEAASVVGTAATYDGKGLYYLSSNGGVIGAGDATFHNALPGIGVKVNNIVGMAPTSDGGGYYLVASDGGVFAFGDATFQGSMGGKKLNQPIVGMAIDQATSGYWLVAADGGIFSFNAPFYGSTGALHLNKPIVGMEAAPDGSGYRFVASDGGVFSFNLPFSGSMGGTPLNQPVVAMAPYGTSGYWLVAADGGIFTFGGAPFYGSPA